MKLNLKGARTTDPHTSHESAEENREQSETIAERVVDLALAAGNDGITSYEAASRLNINIISVSPVIKPLIDDGFLFRHVIGHKPSGREIYQTRINPDSGQPVTINFHHTIKKKDAVSAESLQTTATARTERRRRERRQGGDRRKSR